MSYAEKLDALDMVIHTLKEHEQSLSASAEAMEKIVPVISTLTDKLLALNKRIEALEEAHVDDGK